LLYCPLMPRARGVDAVHPDIGVDEYAGRTVVARKTSETHDVLRSWSVRRPG
jgi:hypothetical protein